MPPAREATYFTRTGTAREPLSGGHAAMQQASRDFDVAMESARKLYKTRDLQQVPVVGCRAACGRQWLREVDVFAGQPAPQLRAPLPTIIRTIDQILAGEERV